MRRAGSFGARACRAIRVRLLRDGVAALPRGWRRSWIIARIKATPPWADFDQIRKVYAEASRRHLQTGIPQQVNHRIPLQHPNVCGLHVHNNLEVLTAKQNNARRNYWCPDQLELF
jgi:hypothetical protein